MAARIPLVSSLSATGGPASNGASASIHIRLANPPYLFVATGGFTGSVAIQHSLDTYPAPAQQGLSSPGAGVTDANATWITIISSIASGSQTQWDYPLYRVRVLATSVTGGTSATVTMLEGIRSLAGDSDRVKQTEQTTEN